MATYDPYQKNDNLGGILGGVGGKILSVLAMFGMSGKGPLKFLEGMMGGIPGKEEETPIDTQVIQGGGQGGGMGAGMLSNLMQMAPPPQSTPQMTAPQGPPLQMGPQGPPPGPPMGGQMGQMGPQGPPQMGPQGPPMGGPPMGQGQDPNQIMQMIMAMLSRGGQGGGMLR